MKLLEKRRHSANLECTAVAHKQAQQPQQQFFQWFVVGTTALILLLIGVASYRSLTQQIAGSNAAIHSSLAQSKLENILFLSADVETGYHGYVITKQESSLVPYNRYQGRIVSFNRACESLSSYSASEVIGKYFWELFLSEEVEPVKAAFFELQAGYPNSFENYWLTKTGDRRLISYSSTPILDTVKYVKYIIGTGINITGRTLAEQNLRQSEKKYRDLIESANNLIQSFSPDGKLLYANRAWLDLGYSETEISNLSMLDIIHRDCQADCLEVWQRVIAVETIKDVEAEFITKNGKKISVLGSINYQFVDNKPAFTRIRHITHEQLDLSIKRLYQQGQRSQNILRLVMDLFPLAIWWKDCDSKFLGCNQNFAQMAGVSPVHLIGKTDYDIWTKHSFR